MTLRNLSRGLIIPGLLAIAVAWATPARAQTTISGTVTNALGQGVSTARVQLVRATSGPPGPMISSQANASGEFSFFNVASGSYFLLTSNNSRLINRVRGAGSDTVVHVGGSMVGSYQGLSPLVVSGTPVTGMNFQLSEGGTISGTVTAAAGGGVPSASVWFYTAEGVSLTSTSVNQTTGAYESPGLPAGQYRVRTTNSSGFVNLVYPTTVCLFCAGTLGELITVGATGATPNINFVLSPGGSISGTVTNAATSATLTGIGINVYLPNGTFVTSSSSMTQGFYTVGGLPAGDYRVKTSNSSGFINEAYNDIECLNCANTTGDLVTVASGVATPNINFALTPGATITGTVRDAQGVGLANVSVGIFNEQNTTVGVVGTNGSGVYTRSGLAPGTYYVRTSNALGLVDQIYNGTSCVFCSVIAGTPVTATAGAVTGDINFQLVAGGGISGTVTGPDAAPLSGVVVQIYGASGALIESRTTNAQGQYASARGLPPGNYFVRSRNSSGFVDKLYPDIVCVDCNPLRGQAVVVSASAVTTGVNLALSSGARISGVVTATGGSPLASVRVTVHAANGTQMASGTTTTSGEYETGALPAGTYYVRTNNTIGYLDQVHQGVVCVNCNPTTGTPVTVTGTTPVTGINFALTLGGRISGTVRTPDGTPIAGIEVRVAVATGAFATRGFTDAQGQYVVETGLQAGTYYAKTLNVIGYVDMVYSGVACGRPSCEVTVGTPITVAAGENTTGIDFTLATGGRIAGTITDSVTSAGIRFAFANVYTSTGEFVTQAQAEGNGRYVTRTALAPGSYFVRAASRQGYVSKVWNNISCPACSPITGTPVTVAANATTADINFSLVPTRRLSGIVTSAATGAPLAEVAVQVFNSANHLVTTSSTDEEGRYVSGSGLPPGTYYVRTSQAYDVVDVIPPAPLGEPAFVDQLHAGITCLACRPNSGTPVVIPEGADVTGINFSLATGGRIEGAVTNQTTGLPLLGVHIDVYNTNGRIVDRSRSDASGRYATQGGLPPGTYYVVAEGASYINKVYDNTECAGCDPRRGTPVQIVGTAHTTGINFTLALGGSIRGTVTAGDTQLPLGSVRVVLYSASGSYLQETVTDAAGRFEGVGLAAGSYFMRTFNLAGYVDEAFNDVACSPCDLLGSTPITVTTGVTVSDRNFALAKGGLVRGHVVDATSGAPLEGVVVRFLSGGTVVGRAAPTNEHGYYAISLPVGTYTAVTNAVNGYATSGVSTRGDTSQVAAAQSMVTVALGGETSGVTFGLAACVPPTFDHTSLALGQVTQAYNFAVSATGGAGGFVFNLADGLLAPGLSLSAAGAITGTPTVQGTANFTLGVVDSAGCAATQAFALTVDPAPPVTAPGAPTAVSAVAGNAQVTVSFTAPGTSGGSAITGYTVTASPGGATATGAASPLVVTGLTNGTAYTFTVTATNVAGTGVASAATPAVTPLAPTLSAAPAALVFAATKAGPDGAVASVTQTQTVQVAATGTPAAQWTATANASWVHITHGTGAGAGTFQVSIINPGNVIAASTNLSATITIAASNAGTSAQVAVTLTVHQQPGQTTAPIGQVDTPAQAATGVQGAIAMTGWVVDDVGIQHVRIYRQCLAFESQAACQTVLGASVVLVGEASVISGARPDVQTLYPTLPAANSTGWGFLILSNLLPNIATSTASGGGVGTFTLYAVATDQEGNQRLLGRTINDSTPTSVTVANDTIAKPFGAIDTPTQGQTVSGTLNNFGWALTPDLDTVADPTDILVPTAGNTVNVFIDGVSVGTATYNLCRGSVAVGGVTPTGVLCDDDVSSIFRPGGRYRNLDAGRGPIGLRSINTTGLSNGLHTIQWGVTDSASRGEGIGSRYFTVLNSMAAKAAGSTEQTDFSPSDVRRAALDAARAGEARRLRELPVAALVVYGRTGFNERQAFVPVTSVDGVPTIVVSEMGRVELQIPGATHVALLANGSLRDAPVGMSVDEDAGMVRWSVGPGYLGTYRLSIDRADDQVLIDVVVAPMALVDEPVRMHLDRADVYGAVFTLHGWALDPQADTGSGIGAVHIWARKKMSSEAIFGKIASELVFLGIADLGVARPDVAAAHGARFTHAGFTFQGVLDAGDWEVTAYIWNYRTGRFEDARSLLVSVK